MRHSTFMLFIQNSGKTFIAWLFSKISVFLQYSFVCGVFVNEQLFSQNLCNQIYLYLIWFTWLSCLILLPCYLNKLLVENQNWQQVAIPILLYLADFGWNICGASAPDHPSTCPFPLQKRAQLRGDKKKTEYKC